MSEVTVDSKVFKIIKDYPNYAISRCGAVINIRNENVMQHLLRGASTTTDYYYVGISNDVRVKKYLVHRLIAEYWIPNPDNKSSVNHKDGNKHNNHISNLEWVTRSENQRHAITTGLKGKGDLLYNSELTEDDVHLVCKHLVDGWLIVDIANKFSVSKDIIRKIRAGDTYFHVRVLYEIPHTYKSDFSESTVRWVCQRIVDGNADKWIANNSTNSKMTIIDVKRIRYKIRYKIISDEYF